LPATARKRRSLVIPITACATQSVTTSASVSLRRADPGRSRQEIVSRAESGCEEHVEVGVHRGLPVDGGLDAADFGHGSPKLSNTAPAVESTI
jgi:hypothetical protein